MHKTVYINRLYWVLCLIRFELNTSNLIFKLTRFPRKANSFTTITPWISWGLHYWCFPLCRLDFHLFLYLVVLEDHQNHSTTTSFFSYFCFSLQSPHHARQQTELIRLVKRLLSIPLRHQNHLLVQKATFELHFANEQKLWAPNCHNLTALWHWIAGWEVIQKDHLFLVSEIKDWASKLEFLLFFTVVKNRQFDSQWSSLDLFGCHQWKDRGANEESTPLTR